MARSHTWYNTASGSIRLGEELGGGLNLDMRVAEVVVYNRAISSIELQQIVDYFQARYALASDSNTPPTVTITSPANNATFTAGSAVGLAASASDTQDGTLTAAITWTSDRDGALGSGGSVTVSTLSVGTHLLTAAVTDSGGLTASATRTITVTAGGGNTPPTVTITSPANNATFTAGSAVGLAASASDTQDGTLTAAITWTSDRDGALGSGGSVTVSTLSVGTHLLTAAVTDSGGLTASATRTITVTSGSGTLITSGLVVHLEADLNVSFQSGTTVAGWLDQSGLGNDLVASGTPQWIATATPTGQSAISLKGAGDKLERLHAINPLGGLPAANGNRTMFLVAKYDGASAWGGLAYGSGGGNQAFGLVVQHPGGADVAGLGRRERPGLDHARHRRGLVDPGRGACRRHGDALQE